MSYLNTRNALITQLLSSSIVHIDSGDIAYDNRDFDPQGKDAFITAYFVPADSISLGKSVSDGDQDNGFFQVSVSVKPDGYDVKQMEIIDSVLSAFKNSSTLSYLDQEVHILDSSVNGGLLSGGWWKRDVTISYLTISTR